MIFVYAGTGRAEIDDVDYELEPECTILVGPYIQHYVENTGSTPLRMLWIISPRGWRNGSQVLADLAQQAMRYPSRSSVHWMSRKIQARMKFVNPDSDTK